MRDQVRRRGQDVAGGTVVALEPNDLGAWKVVLEAQDVVDLRAAPAIDRLVVVADAADVFGGGLRRCLFPLSPCGRGWWRGRGRGGRVGVGGGFAPFPLPPLRGGEGGGGGGGGRGVGGLLHEEALR